MVPFRIIDKIGKKLPFGTPDCRNSFSDQSTLVICARSDRGETAPDERGEHTNGRETVVAASVASKRNASLESIMNYVGDGSIYMLSYGSSKN